MDEVLVPKSEYNNASRELITVKAVETTEFSSTVQDTLASRKLVSKGAIVRKEQCATLKAQFPSEKGSGKWFLNLKRHHS